MFNTRQALHQDIDIIFSTVQDGSMAAGGGRPSSLEQQRNADKFLEEHGFGLERYRILVRYGEGRTYDQVVRVESATEAGDIVSDALYTTLPDVTITLSVADCVATVVYDPRTQMVGVLHLGRHSSVAGLIESFVIDVADNVGSDPRDWLVWMGPSLRQDNDRLDYFDPADIEEWRDYTRVGSDGKIHIDTVGHNVARFVRAGVSDKNIIISPLDTYSDRRFYSQRAYTEQDDPSRLGRMMVAVRRPR